MAEVGSTIQSHGLIFVAGILLFYGGLASVSCFATPVDWQKLELFSSGLGRGASVQERSLRLCLSLALLWLVIAVIWFVLGLGAFNLGLLLPLLLGAVFAFLSQALKSSSTETKAKQGSSYFLGYFCLLYTSPSPRDATLSRMPSSA